MVNSLLTLFGLCITELAFHVQVMTTQDEANMVANNETTASLSSGYSYYNIRGLISANG